MKHIFILGLLMMAGPGFSERAGTDEAVDLGKGMALVRVGDISEDLLERVREFVQNNTAIPVRIRDTRSGEANTLDDIGIIQGEEMKPEDVVLIVLAWPDEEHKVHAVYLYDERVAVVNARALDHPEDPDLYVRRVKRVVLRSAGVMFGVEAVPNPHSAMFPYRTLEELDAIGLNFDPPSLRRIQEAALEKGIELDRKSAPILVR